MASPARFTLYQDAPQQRHLYTTLATIPPAAVSRDGHRSRRFPGAPKDGASGVVAGTAACRLGGTGYDSGAAPPAAPRGRRWRWRAGPEEPPHDDEAAAGAAEPALR